MNYVKENEKKNKRSDAKYMCSMYEKQYKGVIITLRPA